MSYVMTSYLSPVQTAAGTFNFLLSSALPSLEFAPDDEDIPLDLTEAFVKSLEFLMLAQAQECAWQKAVVGKTYTLHRVAYLVLKTLGQVILRMV